jgi:transposase
MTNLAAQLGKKIRKLTVRPNKPRNRVKILYWERNGFFLWLKRLEFERFKTSPEASDEAVVLSVQELNWLLDGFDLWRNRPHQVLPHAT